MVACLGPFLVAPRVQIGYTLGSQAVSQSLALPCVVAKFCTAPETLVPKEAFFQRWLSHSGSYPSFACCQSTCTVNARQTASHGSSLQ